MLLHADLYFWLVVLWISRPIAALSFHQPKFCANATWDPVGITFVDAIYQPFGLFVNLDDDVYVTEQMINCVKIYAENGTAIRMLSGQIRNPGAIFVSDQGDVYVDGGYENQTVKWAPNSTNGIVIVNISTASLGLFIDINSTLYFSLDTDNKVMKVSLNGNSNSPTLVAGTGIAGLQSTQLDHPNGIFVTVDFDLYVADCFNNRIQRFRLEESNGTTVAGNGAPGTINLWGPTGVILDNDGYLFISDAFNHRIIGSGPNGFRCIAGCLGSPGPTSISLNAPRTIGFDSHGNIYVSDLNNNRIQKFLLMTNSCGQATTAQQMTTTTVLDQTSTLLFSTTTEASIVTTTLTTQIIQLTTIEANTTMINYAETETSNIAITSMNQTIPITTTETSTIGVILTTIGANPTTTTTYAETETSTVAVTLTEMKISTYVTPVMNQTAPSTTTEANTIATTFISQTIPLTAIETSTTATTYAGIETSTTATTYAGIDTSATATTYAGIETSTVVTTTTETKMSTSVTPVMNQTAPLTTAERSTIAAILTTIGVNTTTTTTTYAITHTSTVVTTPTEMEMGTTGTLFMNQTTPLTTMQNNTIATISTTTTMNTILTTHIEMGTSTIAMTSTPRSTTIAVSPNVSACTPPVVTLFSSISSLSQPLEFRRSKAFTITSTIQINCNNSSAITTLWTIHTCNSNCSSQLQIDPTIDTTFTEIYIPAKTLSNGMYQFILTVTMASSPHVSSSTSTYVNIVPTNIIVNMIMYGASMITRGYTQDLLLDPGQFSVDPDEDTFNTSDWQYEYFCRIYTTNDSSNLSSPSSTIDSCLTNRSNNVTQWHYGGKVASPQSSLILLSGSLTSNETYQFMVTMKNRHNTQLQSTGYLLVQVTDTPVPLIVITCVISTMCVADAEFQRLNPTTQMALSSVCIDSCSAVDRISWNIYKGVMNFTSNTVHWTHYDQLDLYENIWFFGMNTTNFTALSRLFADHPSILYWRFEVVYTSVSSLMNSTSALNFVINESPRNGSCSIDPLNGTTNTLFTVSCPHWFDEDGIEDYSLYLSTTDHSLKSIVAFSATAPFEVRLPGGLIHLLVDIRDTFDCVTHWHFTDSVIVVQETTNINALTSLLASGNQNIIGQILISLAQQINNDIPVVPIPNLSTTPLGGSASSQSSTSVNASVLAEYKQQLNTHAETREYLLTFPSKLPITTANSIKLQATVLTQLTQTTDQLTRKSSTMASERCHQLAIGLDGMALQTAYDDIQMAANEIFECTSNVLTATNGALQQRAMSLDLDYMRANALPQDYEADLESEWSNPNLFGDGNDFSAETIENNRNRYYQQKNAKEIFVQTTETISALTSALNVHLNMAQNFTLNTSSILVLLKTVSFDSLSSESIEPLQDVKIHLPSDLNSTSTGSIRLIIQPLATAGQSQLPSPTNLSRSISFSILDRVGNEIFPLSNKVNDRTELIIPRDPNAIIPSMTLQNVTDTTDQHHFFYLHHVALSSLTPNLSVSVHLEMHPLNVTLAYAFIYRFDHSPQMNQFDDWTVWCPSQLNNEQIYTYFIDNQQTLTHQSVIFGIRELNASEKKLFCTLSNQSTIDLSMFNETFRFTSNYELRSYSSACYYLDDENQWRSDGLVVGPLTNHHQTQCFSFH